MNRKTKRALEKKHGDKIKIYKEEDRAQAIQDFLREKLDEMAGIFPPDFTFTFVARGPIKEANTVLTTDSNLKAVTEMILEMDQP